MTDYALARQASGGRPRLYLVPSPGRSGPTETDRSDVGWCPTSPITVPRTTVPWTSVRSTALHPSVQRPSPVRLTRRGRVFLRSFLIVVIALLVVTVAAQTQAAMDTGSGQGRKSVVVAPGDTVRSIAAQHTEGRYMSTTVSEIAELNDLEGFRIEPGQRLLLP